VAHTHGSLGEYFVSSAVVHRFSLPSAQEMSALDRETLDRGVTALDLMERAGAAVAERTLAAYPEARSAVVLCGPGNNGGDGLVLARILAGRGISTRVVLVAAKRYSPECVEQLRAVSDVRVFGGIASFEAVDERMLQPVTASELRDLCELSDVVIDALLGTGQKDAPRGPIAEIIEVVGAAKKLGARFRVIAVDIPTGVNGDTGNTFCPHLVADRTVAVQCIKRGMLQFPARGACGVIEAVDIGIAGKVAVEYSLVAKENLPAMLPRPADAHKGILGKVLVIGGSLAMPGAPMLAALGALRAGSGIVSRCVRRGWETIPPLPEAMFEVLSGNATTFQPSDVASLAEMAGRYDVFVIGPGLGTDSGTADFLVGLLEVLRARAARVIIDADALNLLAIRKVTLRGLAAIVTPHPGEASRLLGISSSEVQRDRFGAVREIATRLEAIAVLKGAGSLIHDGTVGKLVAEGTPYLATPGSGDVLAGILAACAVRTQSLWEAAVLGVWLHAMAGIAAAERRRGPILASEITECLGEFVSARE
jgi:hydroxyethylthiazole kinase-like uncharacterized protein yjeF